MARKNDRPDVVVVAEVMEAGAETKPLKGKSFSITGHLSRPRDNIVALIEQAGGRFDKTPSFGTTYLITNQDWSEGTVHGVSKKLQKARSNGTKVLTEQQFLDLLMKEPPMPG